MRRKRHGKGGKISGSHGERHGTDVHASSQTRKKVVRKKRGGWGGAPKIPKSLMKRRDFVGHKEKRRVVERGVPRGPTRKKRQE